MTIVELIDAHEGFSIITNKITTNKLLSNTILEVEKTPFYVAMLNTRLNRLKEIISSSKNTNISQRIDNMKPPIFWKDKSNYLDQIKVWDLNKINKALKITYELEVKVKSNANVNKNLLIKKLLIDICLLATS